jgi:hypothetical protein
MQVVAFEPKLHLSHISSWLEARKISVPNSKEFPKLGLVVQYEGKPIAMGFLRMVEGNYAQLDGMTTNPEASPELRNRANDVLTQNLLDTAKRLKIKKIIAFTLDENTLMRSFRHGFVKLSHSLIAIDPSADEHFNPQE